MSASTVETASTKEKAESIPRVKSVTAKSIAQKFAPGMVSIAVGYDMKAREIEVTY